MCLRVRWSQEIVQEAEMTSESTTFGSPLHWFAICSTSSLLSCYTMVMVAQNGCMSHTFPFLMLTIYSYKMLLNLWIAISS